MIHIKKYINQRYLPYTFLLAGLLALTYLLGQANLIASVGIIAVPFVLLFVIGVLYNPYWGFLTIFVLNYFMNASIKYTQIDGLSVLLDAIIIYTFISILFNTAGGMRYPWKRVDNKLFYLALVWMLYVILELFNPSALFTAWIYHRGQIYSFVVMIVLTSLLLSKVKDIQRILFLLSIFTLIAVAKAIGQKMFGFDDAEWRWLQEGSASTHIIASGVRYFSIFSDAGNFGSNMGFALVVYLIMSFYVKKKGLRLYYFIVAVLAGYALVLSGTRGAVIVPLGGAVMFILLNKNIRQMVTAGIVLLLVYLFFAHTWILEGNPQVRRMRSAFRPTQDASFNVRLENQRRLAQYMKHKPFGEGLGLAGVENRRFSYRYTTMIPTDSHFVNIWVQFGIVGLCLHLAILLFVIIYSGYLILFRIRNKELKGMLIALNCGLFGIMLSAYGNNFFLQYPTGYIVYMCQTFLVLGESYDKEISGNSELKQLQTVIS